MVKEDLDFVICLGDYIYAEDYYPVVRRAACATTRWATRRRWTIPGQVHAYRTDPA